jgi:hypothetical protein
MLCAVEQKERQYIIKINLLDQVVVRDFSGVKLETMFLWKIISTQELVTWRKKSEECDSDDDLSGLTKSKPKKVMQNHKKK